VVAAALAQALNDMFTEEGKQEKELSVEELTASIRSTTSKVVV
jgi:hypothetical protein